MDYVIVTGQTIETLTEKVKSLQVLKWQTTGGVSYSSNGKLFMQSMVLYDASNPNSDDYEEDQQSETDNSELDENRLIPVAIFEGLEDYVKEEPEPEFLAAVDKELSKKAALLIYKKSIVSVQGLLTQMKNHWFREEAGKEILEEFNNLIEKRKWKGK